MLLKGVGGDRMKIGMSVKNCGMEPLLDSRFGRSKYFYLYETDKDITTIVENKGQYADGGAGIVAAGQMVDEHVDVVITGHLGPNAYRVIETSGIKAYQSDERDLKAVLKDFRNGDLEAIDKPGRAHRG